MVIVTDQRSIAIKTSQAMYREFIQKPHWGCVSLITQSMYDSHTGQTRPQPEHQQYQQKMTGTERKGNIYTENAEHDTWGKKDDTWRNKEWEEEETMIPTHARACTHTHTHTHTRTNAHTHTRPHARRYARTRTHTHKHTHTRTHTHKHTH